MKISIFSILFILTSVAFGQKLTKAEKDSIKAYYSETAYSDSVIFASGDHLVGKIKQLDRSILKMKTPYSKSDFQIKWLKVKEIYSDRNYSIMTNSGTDLFGRIEMDSTDKSIAYIVQENGLRRPVIFKEILFIKRIEKKFWDRVKANIDAGYTWTRAQNQHQVSVQAGATYYGRKLRFTLGTNIVRTIQDSSDQIKRTEGDLGLQVYMPKEFFYFLQNNSLSNTEQLLKLRNGLATGFGYYYLNSNRMNGYIGLGALWNNETFTNDSINRNSIEGFISFRYEIFNLGDLNIETYVNTMPSFTELGRVRVDLKAHVRYKFPFDLYLGASFTMNYDNRPTQDASPLDYVLQTSIGWSW